ncbi:4Fe-4S dicluster domain-containing protein [Clostridium sp. WLY-B-L2]|uniref:4Fe-4S dicluster domain-containing protein n=1 Tax=Clostridium aromativorans TaxID=2836848 RepID=A0ABS8N2R9_9CLOT|nr:4Fe-4S dicluster domain-containing protein [Clostridium aromativorans]MCC9294111.1 4Fe-4S dicluster domain-containing protein [Clostridium aromativorans]
MKNCFVMADPNKCIGCRTCEAACAIEHSGEDFFNVSISKINFNPRLNVIKNAKVSVPVQCRQCEDSPCLRVCPVNAISNEEGLVFVNKNMCIGCKSCLIACPYGTIELVTEYEEGEKTLKNRFRVVSEDKAVQEEKDKVVANKCDLCRGRKNGPACIEVCPTQALQLVTYDDSGNIVKKKSANECRVG